MRTGRLMNETTLLAASCRVALAGLLHDLGKFAERAGLDVSPDLLEANVHQYCPRHEAKGKLWHTHKHAAYTAMALDRLEPLLPPLRGRDVAPFAAWGAAEADDSLINAAARHHRPETFLQWVVATADRVASGFDRERFEEYNRAADETTLRLNHVTARQLTLFEQVRLGAPVATLEEQLLWRYPLAPLSPESIFPTKAAHYETADRGQARAEYHRLWEGFETALKGIPQSHRASLDLWLDHFESLWACYAHAIPSATAFGVRPDISLYDHAKAVAALATAFWRYHHDRGDDPDAARDAMRGYRDWDDHKLLLVQGDLFGIQDFIFATGGETQRRAAKLLRGRSFYAGLVTECAALKVLSALDLPPTSQIVNAAGKFLIVAPNSVNARTRLAAVRAELDAWFLTHTYGQAGVGVAWHPASCNDFRHGSQVASPFRKLMKRLFDALEDAKLQRFELCGDAPPQPLFEGFLDRFQQGACAVDGRTPAEIPLSPGSDVRVSGLAMDQLTIGGALIGRERLLVTGKPLSGSGVTALRVPVFGYHVTFTDAEEVTGRFGAEAESGNLLRAWDFSLPESADRPLFHGYGRRYINAYVPRFETLNAWEEDRYRRCVSDIEVECDMGGVKTFEHLACDAQQLDDKGAWVGVAALMSLKGDVDNLGLIFQRGLNAPSFARMAALSRMIHAFFAIHLPWLCRSQFRDTYTVFAGGDDFFLIGPWRQQVMLARQLRDDFARYGAGNPELHFSCGMVMTKPGLPVRYLAAAGEQALESAKGHGPTPQHPSTKNAVNCFGETVAWEDFIRLLEASGKLSELADQYGLSTRYLYGLLGLIDMAENLKSVEARPDNARWRSHFVYRTYRMLERKKVPKEERTKVLSELANIIAERGIEDYRGCYRIALFNHLYQHRD